MYMGAAICWMSRKVKATPQSSTEAEMAAGVPAAKDIRFVRHILTFFKAPLAGPTPLLIDNEGMWNNIRNEGVSQRTRYWELWLHFVREMYTRRILNPLKVDTTEERADMLTKAMTKDNADYVKFRDGVMNTKN